MSEETDILMHAMLELTEGHSVTEILAVINAMVASLIATAPTPELQQQVLKKFITDLTMTVLLMEEVQS